MILLRRIIFTTCATNLQKIQIANILNWMQTCTEGLQGYNRSKIKPLIFMCGIYRQLWDFSPMTVFYTMQISMDIMTASLQVFVL